MRQLSGIVTSTFKVGTGGCFAAPSFPGLSGVFLIILVLYSNDLQPEVLSSTSSISSL